MGAAAVEAAGDSAKTVEIPRGNKMRTRNKRRAMWVSSWTLKTA
jgi:hypothetical protein